MTALAKKTVPKKLPDGLLADYRKLEDLIGKPRFHKIPGTPRSRIY